MYCPGCGKETEEDNKFCRHCGASLVKTDEKPPEPVISEPVPLRKPGQRITGTTIALLALLGIRFIGSLVTAFQNPFSVLDVAAYLAAIVGVWLKTKWGLILTIGYHILAIVVTPFSYASEGTAFILGGIAFDLFIIGLAWNEYRRLKDGENKIV